MADAGVVALELRAASREDPRRRIQMQRGSMPRLLRGMTKLEAVTLNDGCDRHAGLSMLAFTMKGLQRAGALRSLRLLCVNNGFFYFSNAVMDTSILDDTFPGLRHLTIEAQAFDSSSIDPSSRSDLSCLTSVELLRCSEMGGRPLIVPDMETALQVLSLQDSIVRDLSPLAPLTQLRKLTLSSDVYLAPLSSLPMLEELNAVHLSAGNATSLSLLTQIRRLTLQFSHIEGDENPSIQPDGNWLVLMGPFASCTSLEKLAIRDASIPDLAPLASLTRLRTLSLFNASLLDAGPLAACSALEDLDLTESSVSNLSPLSSLPRLRILTLDWEYSRSMSDLGPLAGFTVLEKLSLRNNPSVEDLTPLASLNRLKSLSLEVVRDSDLRPLATCMALETLRLGGTGISDLSPLSALTRLVGLDLFGTMVMHLAPLAACTALEMLRLTRAPTLDLSPLSSLTCLTALDLNLSGSVVDLGPLAACTRLELLYLEKTGVSDLTPLSSLTRLLALDIRGTLVSDLSPLAACRLLEALNATGSPAGRLPLPFKRKMEKKCREVFLLCGLRCGLRDDRREQGDGFQVFFLTCSLSGSWTQVWFFFCSLFGSFLYDHMCRDALLLWPHLVDSPSKLPGCPLLWQRCHSLRVNGSLRAIGGRHSFWWSIGV